MERGGVFEELWRQALLEYDEVVGLRWPWQSIDGAMTEAPLGGEATGPNPTDRAKSGTKSRLLTKAAGIPIGSAIGPTNRKDRKLIRKTLDSRQLLPLHSASQSLCLDKGYDYPEVPEILEVSEFVAQIRSRGGKIRETERNRTRRRVRWGVERAHSFMNRFRRLLVRREGKLVNYLALAQFAGAWITYRDAGLFPAR